MTQFTPQTLNFCRQQTCGISSKKSFWGSIPRLTPRAVSIKKGITSYIAAQTNGVKVLQVCRTAPIIVKQPADKYRNYNEPPSEGDIGFLLEVAVTGMPPFSYQWYKGFSGDLSQPISGETNSIAEVIPNAISGKYWVRIANAVGTADSREATVAYRPIIRIFIIEGEWYLRIAAAPGTNWKLQASPDLQSWQSIGQTFTSPQDRLTFVLFPVQNNGNQFFRITSEALPP